MSLPTRALLRGSKMKTVDAIRRRERPQKGWLNSLSPGIDAQQFLDELQDVNSFNSRPRK
jgi:hypothetical protein